MSRFVAVILVVGVVAAAVGFGNIVGIPNRAELVAKALAGLCLIAIVVLSISHIGPSPRVRKRPQRDHRSPPR